MKRKTKQELLTVSATISRIGLGLSYILCGVAIVNNNGLALLLTLVVFPILFTIVEHKSIQEYYKIEHRIIKNNIT